MFPEQRITVEQAVSAFTTGAAYANYEENIKGSIEPGKFADLVVLSDDIFAVDKDSIKDIKVEKTLIGGKVVFSM